MEADHLARTASALEGTWKGDLAVLHADTRSGVAEIYSMQEIMDWRASVIQILKSDDHAEGTMNRKEKILRANFFLMGGFLYMRSFTRPYLKCLSEQEGEYLLREMHEGAAGAQKGFKDLARKVLRDGFFWPTIEKDAKGLVKQCEHCQKHGRLIHKPAEEMGAMFSPYPFNKWGIYIIGKFSTAPGERVLLIIAINYFTKWVEAEAVVKITQEVMKKFIWKNICF